MKRVVAVLETMWDWGAATSRAGYHEAPRFFRINPHNFTGRRLYAIIGSDVRLLVTESCRELVTRPHQHGTPDPVWLGENLKAIEDLAPIDVLLVCGKVAQATFKQCGYVPKHADVIEMPHPAARTWTKGRVIEASARVRKALWPQ